jgi:Cu(I)/Ag(I) efflux system protein CusF
MKTAFIALTVIALNLPLATFAQATDAKPAATAAALTEGEVRKVDLDAKKITIKHGPIANLDMPPMTMVFQVQEAAMLDQVKAGDRIRFSAEKVGGQYVVTRIDSAS